MTVPVLDAECVAPAYIHRPNAYRTMAPALTRLSAKLGRPLFDEQITALEVLTGEHADGRACSRLVCVICGRQNMKTWIMQLIVLGRILRRPVPHLAVWSAHEVATSQQTFIDFQELIDLDENAWLRQHVRKVINANGKEAIHFTNSRRLSFRARLRTGGRGLTGDTVGLDEGFALLPEHMGSILPILSTKMAGAVFVGSSAGLEMSAVLRGIRDRGRAGRLGYIEYAAPGSMKEPGCVDPECRHDPGELRYGPTACALDSLDLVTLANPAVRVGRIGVEALQSERDNMTPGEWARERLTWWSLPLLDTDSPITLEMWGKLALREGESLDIVGTPVLCLDISPNRASAAIALAGYRDDRTIQVEVKDHRPGEGWVLGELAGAFAAGMRDIALDEKGPAGVLASDIEALGFTVHRMSSTHWGEACGGLHRDVIADPPGVRHLGDRVLSRALGLAARRPVGDAGSWAWARLRSDGDITPIAAATGAHWLLKQVGGPSRPASDIF